MDAGRDLDLENDECGLLDATGLTGMEVDPAGVEAAVTGGADETGGVDVGATDGVVVVEVIVVEDVVVELEEVVDVDVAFGAPQVAASLLEYDVPTLQERGPQSAAKAAPGTKVATVGVCPRLFPRSS